MAGFSQFKINPFVGFNDVPAGGSVATVQRATQEEFEVFQSNPKETELRIVLYFYEYKPLKITNTGLDILEACFPTLDLNTITGARVWLTPVEQMVGKDLRKYIILDQNQTLRMQASPGPLPIPAPPPPPPGPPLPPAAVGTPQPPTAASPPHPGTQTHYPAQRDPNVAARVPPPGDDDIPF